MSEPICISHSRIPLAWAINIHQRPFLGRLCGTKLNGQRKIFFHNHRASKDGTILDCDDPSRGPIRGYVSKFVKSLRAARLNEHIINGGFFVSCRQIIAQPLEAIALDSAKSLGSEFKPRTFQHRMFQFNKEDMKG